MRTTNLQILFKIFGRYRLHIAALVALGFFGAILEGIGINALIPLLSFLVNNGQPSDFISITIAKLFAFFHIRFTFRYIFALIIGLFLARAASVVLFGYIRGRITAHFLSSKSQEMISLLMSASWAFLLRQKLGHLHNTLNRDLQRSSSLLESVGQVIQSFTGFFIYLVVAVNISPIITLSTLIAGGILLLILRPLMRRIQQTGVAMAATEKNISHLLSERIIGMKAVKAANAEAKTLEQSGRLFDYLRRLYIKMAAVRALSGSLFQPFSIIFVVTLFAITYTSNTFNLISFAATLYLIQKIFTYLESGQNALGGVREMLPYAESVEHLKAQLIAHVEIEERGNTDFTLHTSIMFKEVELQYEEGNPVLQKTSFIIPKGTIVGLVGPSGAGKTSVADLLLRLFKPTAGEILIDNVPLKSIDMHAWRDRVGYVAQDVFLLNASIEENILFYNDKLSHDEVVAAAKSAYIYDFIQSLPNGFDTVVGDRGVMLSGGQRQRIALARALARKPELLILDEATSALDTESERAIQKAIYALKGSITVLIIAHRLSTVNEADSILVLQKGIVIEEGAPKDLLADPQSYFARLQKL